MSSSKRSRRHFTTEQKVAILKRHMVDKVPVSDLCNEENLQPSVFYQWAPRNFKGGFAAGGARTGRGSGWPSTSRASTMQSGSSVPLSSGAAGASARRASVATCLPSAS
jgi:transposase